MTVGEYLHALRARGIEVRLDGDDLRVMAPRGAVSPDLAEELRGRKAQIVTFLRDAEGATASESEVPLVRRADRSRAPLSSAQQRLFYLAEVDPTSHAYNVPIAWELEGRVDAPRLERALAAVAKRHDVLRSSLCVEDDALVQRVDEQATIPLACEDLRAASEADAREQSERRLREEARRPFDLARAPLARATLLRIANERFVLLVVFHHTVTDGASHAVFESELLSAYENPDAPVAESEPPLQYGDYAAWEASALAGPSFDASIQYWRTQLGTELPVLDLPTDRPRPPHFVSDGAHAERLCRTGLGEKLEQIAREEGATPFMASLAAWTALLHRYTGQREIVIGTPVANRWDSQLASVIGLFVNLIALRIDVEPHRGFRDLVRHVRDVCVAAYAHQRVPFERVVRELGHERDPSRTPVFQCIFALEPAVEPHAATPEDTARGFRVVRRQPVHPGGARTDLSLWLRPGADGLRAMLEYNASLYEAETARRLLHGLEVLLGAAVANPEAPISALPVLDEESRRMVIETWNDTTRRYPRDASLAALFRECAARHADRPALRTPSNPSGPMRDWSYAEIDRLSDSWAAALIDARVAPGSFVGLRMQRSPEFIVGLLATLKAGAAYVPIDPEYPEERQAFLARDAELAALLTQPSLGPAPFELDAPTLSIDLSRPPTASGTVAATVERQATDPAYVMYTSGSTGTPKGVVVPQRAIARLVLGSEFTALDETRVLLQLAPISFDASTLEIWGALLNGGLCVLYPPDRPPAPKDLDEVVRESGVTTLWLTASLFDMMIDDAPWALSGVDEILTGGEALSPDHVRRALRLLPDTTLVNGYGPTENTTFTCCYRIPHDFEPERTSVPIGRPIANTRVYIVDRRLELAPIGAVGELVTGGDGVALGYWNRPDLDRDRFVPDPFAPPSGAGRLYRTGDFARYRPDGAIEYMGRRDDQVKLRGFRIELGEIEAVLRSLPTVEQAVVVHEPDADRGARLVAYVAPEAPEHDPAALRTALLGRIPKPMVPNHFVVLAELPLSPNGKIDRSRLPDAGAVSTRERVSREPQGALETRVLGIWREVLGKPELAPDDDFFEQGGHSLLAVRLLSSVNRALDTRLLLGPLVDQPTAAHCAQLVEQELAGRVIATAPSRAPHARYLIPLREGGSGTPLFVVHGAYGNVLNFRRLPDYLPPNRPLFGIQSKIAAGDLEPHGSIEAMAHAYLEEVRALQPNGPYLIAGFSGGGIVAYEMGRVLQEAGEDVAAILLLDTYPPLGGDLRAHPQKRALRHLDGLRDRGLRYLGERAFDRAGRSWQRWSIDLRLRFRGDLPLEMRQEYAFRTFMEATYQSRPCDVPCFLFRALDEVKRSGITEPTRGWERLARGRLEVIDVEGDHHSMFAESHVAGLCAAITRVLDEVSTPSNADE